MGRAERRQIDQLFRDRYTPLCRAAFAIVGDTHLAEDIVMEAFSCRLKMDTAVQDEAAYIYRSVVNGCLNNRKRAGTEIRANERYLRTLPSYLANDEDRVVFDSNEPLWLSLRHLPSGQRAVVALRLLLDLSERDTAAILDCSVGSVKSQLHKAKQNMVIDLTGSETADDELGASELENLHG